MKRVIFGGREYRVDIDDPRPPKKGDKGDSEERYPAYTLDGSKKPACLLPKSAVFPKFEQRW